jgi:hypothetical protein
LYSRVPNFKIVLVLCIGFMGGCSDSDNRSVQTADQFSYSVLTSDNGKGLDLLEELNSSVLPELTRAGAQEYGIWSWVPESSNDFDEIAEDKLVVMLRWGRVDTILLAEELGAMTGVSDVTTSLWEVSLRGGDGPIETGPGFYIHRFNRYLSEDVDQVLSLSEQAWVTWEPFWDAKAVGVWRDLDEVDESNGVTRLMRIAWYRDMEHWQNTREFLLDPDSFDRFIERAALQLDDESWSASLQPH